MAQSVSEILPETEWVAQTDTLLLTELDQMAIDTAVHLAGGLLWRVTDLEGMELLVAPSTISCGVIGQDIDAHLKHSQIIGTVSSLWLDSPIVYFGFRPPYRRTVETSFKKSILEWHAIPKGFCTSKWQTLSHTHKYFPRSSKIVYQLNSVVGMIVNEISGKFSAQTNNKIATKLFDSEVNALDWIVDQVEQSQIT